MNRKRPHGAINFMTMLPSNPARNIFLLSMCKTGRGRVYGLCQWELRGGLPGVGEAWWGVIGLPWHVSSGDSAKSGWKWRIFDVKTDETQTFQLVEPYEDSSSARLVDAPTSSGRTTTSCPRKPEAVKFLPAPQFTCFVPNRLLQGRIPHPLDPWLVLHG